MITRTKILSASLALLVVGATAAWIITARTPELRWRAMVLLHTASGDVEDLGVTEVLRWIRPGSPVYLEGVATNPNPFVSITNTFTSDGDRQTGEALYQARCARCHGENATGGTGPSLLQPRRGASDWAMFRNIQRGIPQTGMQPQQLDPEQIWQVISFLRASSRETELETGRGPEPNAARTIDAGEIDRTGTGDQWKIFGGSLYGWRYSELAQINRRNVNLLTLAWMHQIESNERMVETTPLVVDNVMFATEPPNSIVALDAATGRVLWRYRRPLPDGITLCCGAVNRGVAISGDTLYMGTLDAHLLAVDAETGRLIWERQVAQGREGYSITSAPLAVRDVVITGVAGGEFGISGFLAAYDRNTGREVWRFETIPEAGERHGETWRGGRDTGGVPTWGTGTYDPELDLVYWGAGHPAPDFNGDGRAGDNLYSNSLLALKPKTGELVWHFQFTPHDEWDWDATQMPVLVDSELHGAKRRLVLFANRNGFYYVLDRSNGDFITGVPFVEQNWADGLSPDGRPIVRQEARPTHEGTLVYPGVTGGTNWWPPSYSPLANLFFVPFLEKPNLFFKWPQEFSTGELYLGGIARPLTGHRHYSGVRALDALTGDKRWELRFPRRGGWSHVGGILTTAGNVLFAGDNRTFYGVDALSGEVLWSVPTGGGINAAPMTFAVDDRQYLTIAAGRALLTFTLARARPESLQVQKLPETALAQ